MAEADSDIALDHFEHPRNVGEMEDADVVGCSENPASGASLKLYLRMDPDGVIVDTLFEARGCTATIAASSVTTELLVGRKLDDDVLTQDELSDVLGGLPATREHAFRLVTDAIQSATRQCRSIPETP